MECKYCKRGMEPLIENFFRCKPCGWSTQKPFTKEETEQLIKDIKKVIG